jgi:ribosome recycling factor
MDTSKAQQRMSQALEHLHDELKKVRTGRANSAMLEGLNVEVYGQLSPLTHVANIHAMDAQTLSIQPFDPSNLNAISAAIRNEQSLGLNPSDDGKVVRVTMPPMTEERRREVVKHMGETIEHARISLRNIRHDELDAAKKQQKEGDISEDDLKGFQKKLDEQIADFNKQIEEAAKAKEAEIMQV